MTGYISTLLSLLPAPYALLPYLVGEKQNKGAVVEPKDNNIINSPTPYFFFIQTTPHNIGTHDAS